MFSLHPPRSLRVFSSPLTHLCNLEHSLQNSPIILFPQTFQTAVRLTFTFTEGLASAWGFEKKSPSKGGALLGGAALLGEVCHRGGGL